MSERCGRGGISELLGRAHMYPFRGRYLVLSVFTCSHIKKLYQKVYKKIIKNMSR
jgi:hypothetical protein